MTEIGQDEKQRWIYVRMGSNDAAKKRPFSKITSAVWKRCREDDVIMENTPGKILFTWKGMYA